MHTTTDQDDPRGSASPLLGREVLESVASQARPGPTYWVYMAAAGVLASVALLSNSVPILVGSMVVAPALAPLVLVPLALVARRPGLAGRGLTTAMSGLLLAFLLAIATTWLMNVAGVIDPATNVLDKPLLEERVNPGWWTLAAAVAAGVAGTVAQSTSKTDTLVGAVAALALVPAGTAAGIALVSGDPRRAVGALVMLAVNVALIVAMGIVTLLATAGRAGWRPLLLAPVALVTASVLLLSWAAGSEVAPLSTSTSTSSQG